MTDYSRQYDFSVKDALTTGDPAKVISGAEVDAEFDALVTSSATKIDKPAAPNEQDLLQFISGAWDATAITDIFAGWSVIHDEDLAGESSVIMTGLVPDTFYIVLMTNFRPDNNTTRYYMRVTAAGVPLTLSDDYVAQKIWYNDQSTGDGFALGDSGTDSAINFPVRTVSGGVTAPAQLHAVWWVTGLGDDINTNIKGLINNPYREELVLRMGDVFRATVHDGIEVGIQTGVFETGRCVILGISLV